MGYTGNQQGIAIELPTMNISVLCPTRKRPDNMRRFTNNIFATSLNPKEIEVIFYIDDDDPNSVNVAKQLQDSGLNIQWMVGPRINLSDYYNHIGPMAKADILLFCGDDIMMRTDDWDETVMRNFDAWPDKIIFAYGSDPDSIMPITFGTQFFLHKNWIDAIGYYTPSYFICDYCDTWFNDIADKIQRKVCLPIELEHLHFTNGKADFDETYRLRRAEHDNARPDILFYTQKMVQQRIDDAECLLKLITHHGSN